MAKHMTEGGEIFIQSDVKDVLDNMRETIRECGKEYFDDTIEDLNNYLEVNPIGIPTEREISVLNEDLPVYRTVFVRNCKTIDGSTVS
jgi:tRNA (guanine-N7-)-methyltransferase